MSNATPAPVDVPALLASARGKGATPPGLPLHQFYLPQKPFTVVDAVNRVYAATGSVSRAIASSHANFNGHHHSLDWNLYRGYYVGEYYWGERCVWYRGNNFAQALARAIEVYDRDGLGSYVTIRVHTDEDKAICEANPRVQKGVEDTKAWYTWAHGEGAACYVRDDKTFGGIPIDLLTSSASYAEYGPKVTALLEARRKGGTFVVRNTDIPLPDHI